MKLNCKKKLKREKSANYSGELLNLGKITILKEANYCIEPVDLDGDAPKRFIRAYFYESGGAVYKSRIKTWKAYIAKSANKWYPHESVTEFLINKIGETIGLNVNKIKLCIINEQIRFLSLYFLDANNQKLVHGAEICGEYLEDEGMAKEIAVDKNTARELFTIEFIIEAINAVFRNYCENLVDQLVKMIVFDAIVGNNDRHFYNWGVITDVRKSESARPVFSPIYDSARGLLWNWSDERVKKSLKNLEKGNKNVENYIEKASPRISIEGNSEVNHFGLIKYIFKKYNNNRGTILDLISLKNEDAVVRMYNAEFKQHFIRERNELILHILRERFKRLREITAI